MAWPRGRHRRGADVLDCLAVVAERVSDSLALLREPGRPRFPTRLELDALGSAATDMDAVEMGVEVVALHAGSLAPLASRDACPCCGRDRASRQLGPGAVLRRAAWSARIPRSVCASPPNGECKGSSNWGRGACRDRRLSRAEHPFPRSTLDAPDAQRRRQIVDNGLLDECGSAPRHEVPACRLLAGETSCPWAAQHPSTEGGNV